MHLLKSSTLIFRQNSKVDSGVSPARLYFCIHKLKRGVKMLDNRLQACADMVSGNGIVCDVGTDHAYLATELIISGKCQKVIAS
ncbi:MAG: class I SAM-dependent methyltransferase, partial [Ruminococcus sp.]|nr:class I SAM-dependent methyltransferase [Ruminococcus sp.]